VTCCVALVGQYGTTRTSRQARNDERDTNDTSYVTCREMWNFGFIRYSRQPLPEPLYSVHYIIGLRHYSAPSSGPINNTGWPIN